MAAIINKLMNAIGIGEEEEYEDQALFIKLMLEDEEFGEFAEVVDEKTIIIDKYNEQKEQNNGEEK